MHSKITKKIKRIRKDKILPINYQYAMFAFVNGLFNESEFPLGNKKSSVNIVVKKVEHLSDPVFKPTMKFRALSPAMFTSKTDGASRYAQYMLPAEEGYAKKAQKKLFRKYAAYCNYNNREISQGDNEGWFCCLEHLPGIKNQEGLEMLKTLMGSGCRSDVNDRRRGVNDYRNDVNHRRSDVNGHRSYDNDCRSDANDHRSYDNDCRSDVNDYRSDVNDHRSDVNDYRNGASTH